MTSDQVADDRQEEESVPLNAKTTMGDTVNKEAGTGRFIYALAFLSSIGGFLFGYDTGVISGAMLIISVEMNLDGLWHQGIVASTILAAGVFALVGGFLSNAVGRKPVILLSSAVFIAGSVTMGTADSQWPLLIGRIIVGIGIGFVSMAVPMYIAEAAHKDVRGSLVTINTMSITGGQAIAGVCSGLLSNTTEGWRYMLGIAAIPATIQFIGFFFMPESPRWLISKGRTEEGKKVLQQIRGSRYDIQDEFQSIQHSEMETKRELEARKQRGQSSWILVQVFTTPSVRRALILGCLLHIVQQIAGINTVMYYSATIIQMSGYYNTSSAIWLSALVASANFLFTFIGVYLVERVGRRRLTLTSLLGVVISLALLAGAFYVVDSGVQPVVNDECAFGSSNCGECINVPGCGFCFREDPVLGITEGTCMEEPENASHATSNWGPCSDPTADAFLDTDGYVWAYDWCPSNYGWMTVVALIFYLFFFAPGMGPMPWTINSEIYPLWARSTCNSIGASVNWACNFYVSMTFIIMAELFSRAAVFLNYCVWSLLGLALLYWLLPETKGQTLEDVEELFSRSRCFCPCNRDSVQPDDKTVHSNLEDQSVIHQLVIEE